MHRFTRLLSRELTLTDYLGDSSFSPAETQTISALARAGAGIAGVLARGKRAAFSGHDNVHGDRVRDYDVIANDLFVDALSQAPGCAGVHSEELVEPLRTNEQAGELLVFLDPLDGSANLDSHGLCGSIFGIAPVAGGVRAAALQTGQGLLPAGYFLYSSATLLVLASRERVDLRGLHVHPQRHDLDATGLPHARERRVVCHEVSLTVAFWSDFGSLAEHVGRLSQLTVQSQGVVGPARPGRARSYRG